MLKRRVLVVDDEPEVIESLGRTLRQEPIAFRGTTSPHEALAIVERGEADLVIADIDMPEMNGLTLISCIKRSRPGVIRILLTGDASSESAMTAINEGEVHRYLTKPWDKDELRRTIKGALARFDELGREARAASHVSDWTQQLSVLEAANPGLTSVAFQDGCYAIDADRLRPVLESLATLVPPGVSAGTDLASTQTAGATTVLSRR